MLFKKKKPDASIYGDYEEKFSDDPYAINELPPEKKPSLMARIRLLTYGPIALGIFTVAFIIFVICMIVAIHSLGNVSLFVGLLGMLSFIISIIGSIVALYGHFIVQVEGKVPWLLALIPNAALATIYLAFYIIGLF